MKTKTEAAAGLPARAVQGAEKAAEREIRKSDDGNERSDNADYVNPAGELIPEVRFAAGHRMSGREKRRDGSRSVSDGKYIRQERKCVSAVKPPAGENTGKASEVVNSAVNSGGSVVTEGGSRAVAAAEKAGKVSERIRRTCEDFGRNARRAGAGAAGIIVFAVMFAVAAVILCSAFGVFFAQSTGDMTFASVAAAVQAEYSAGMQAACSQYSDGSCDTVKVVYTGDADGDSSYINNINDVTGVYAVYVTMNGEHLSDAVTMDSEKAEIFRRIFYAMNSYSVTYEDSVISGVAADGTRTVMTQRTVYVSVYAADYMAGAEIFGFSGEMTAMLEEIMSPQYEMCFTQIYSSGIYSSEDLTDIVSGLPSGTKGSVIVQAALSKLGCPYVWGAKGDYSFDCSGLVYWAVSQADRAAGYELYTSAAGQASFCYRRGLAVGADELEPGDIVFWQKTSCGGCGRWNEIHHTGIYAGGGMVIEASSSRGCVVLRPLWSGSEYVLFMYARVCI